MPKETPEEKAAREQREADEAEDQEIIRDHGFDPDNPEDTYAIRAKRCADALDRKAREREEARRPKPDPVRRRGVL